MCSYLSWSTVRYCVLGRERELEIRYNINVRIYGTGSQGYKFLNDCLYSNYYYKNKKMEADKIWRGAHGYGPKRQLRKQVYEYWIFLNIINILLNGNRLSKKLDVFYEPCSGGYQQKPVININNWNIFVEPSLLPCSRHKIISMMQMCIKQSNIMDNLKNALAQSKTGHNTPDFLISKDSKLIWGALRIFGVFSDDEIEENYRTQQSWQDLRKYWDSIKDCTIIIECKSENININDIAQVIWYKLCYGCETVLISQEPVPQIYKSVLQDCDVYVIDECKICDDYCIKKLNMLKDILEYILQSDE